MRKPTTVIKPVNQPVQRPQLRFAFDGDAVLFSDEAEQVYQKDGLDAFIKSDGQYDYVLNLSALKHVRSEKDPFTLMRMIDVNIFNTENSSSNNNIYQKWS